MKDLKTKAKESIRLAYTGLRHSCCHTYIDTSFGCLLPVRATGGVFIKGSSEHIPYWAATAV
jgi:hypothetical protein